MNTVLFDLQAAVMAAAASSGSSSSPTEIPEDGMGFSDVLAAQAAGSTTGEVTEDTAAVAEDDVQQDSFSEIRELIENADDAVKKALKKLLKSIQKQRLCFLFISTEFQLRWMRFRRYVMSMGRF